MEPFLMLYNALLHSAGYAAAAALRSKGPADETFWRGRHGDYAALNAASRGRPRIWCHAASVGEVSGALPTVRGLLDVLPAAGVTLTVGTWQGYLSACRGVPPSVSVLPFPLDFRPVLRKALRTICPDVYVAFESEFWPNLANLLKDSGVPSVLLNGRVTDRSYRRYKLMKPLFGPIFSQFEWLAMHSEDDLRRAVGLGARPDRALVLGSSKVDGLAARADAERVARWRDLLTWSEGGPTVVGGSLRRSECTSLLEVFGALKREVPGLKGLFVPRHLERIPNMVQWLVERGVPFQFLSKIESGAESRREAVVLVDRIGVLFDLYGLGDLVFCGGTLEPIGGHNILEPAAWEKPVFYGPNVQKVQHEHLTLQSFGGSFEVRDVQELLSAWKYWLVHLDELRERGRRAGNALRAMGGVVERQVGLIRSLVADLA